MDRSLRQKINKETLPLNDTLDQMDIIEIYRTFHIKAGEYTFFSSAHRTYSRIDNVPSHETSLNKLNKIEMISSIFCNHNAMRLEIKSKKMQKKHKHMEAKRYTTKKLMDGSLKKSKKK